VSENRQNLEVRCAELGEKLAKIDGVSEKVLNEALAVLEEQGVYAAFLYLKARYNNVAGKFLGVCQEFLGEVFSLEQGDPLEAAKALARDLDNLLFARELLRTAFVYARYHVKVKEA
jgi:DNA-binding GntR family transcriptional regulator